MNDNKKTQLIVLSKREEIIQYDSKTPCIYHLARDIDINDIFNFTKKN